MLHSRKRILHARVPLKRKGKGKVCALATLKDIGLEELASCIPKHLALGEPRGQGKEFGCHIAWEGTE